MTSPDLAQAILSASVIEDETSHPRQAASWTRCGAMACSHVKHVYRPFEIVMIDVACIAELAIRTLTNSP
jgi:hypothetical protein